MVPVRTPNKRLLYNKRYQFTPKLMSSFITVISIGILIALGFSQLDRFGQMRSLENHFNRLQHLKPFTLPRVLALKTIKNFYPIKIKGEFAVNKFIQTPISYYDGQPGYHLLVPFIPRQGEKYLLVNRGWVPKSKYKQLIALLKQQKGEQQLSGLTYEMPKDLSISHINNYYSFILLEKNSQKEGFTQDWLFLYGNARVHLAYAIQWFALALLLVVIYFTVNNTKIDEGRL